MLNIIITLNKYHPLMYIHAYIYNFAQIDKFLFNNFCIINPFKEGIFILKSILKSIINSYYP